MPFGSLLTAAGLEVPWWLNVLIFLWNAQVERGSDHFGDDLMMDLRGIFKDFVKDPIHVEPPTDADLHWVYNQLLSEEE